jgi:hypothetical protein
MIDYFVDYASSHDINEIVALGVKLVGENHIDGQTLKRRYSINPKIITCLYSPSRELIGYFIIYPLTKSALNEIVAGSLRNGRDIRDEHLCKRFENAAALYIGMAGGIGMHAEGYVVSELLETLRILTRNKSVKAIFTRGATQDGIRVANSYGFQKLASPSEISVLFNSDDLLNHPRVRRHLRLQ